MPSLVLLDIDGTLIDSNDAHARAWEIALREHGREASFEAIRRSIGKGGDKLLPDVTGIDAESALGKALSEARGRIFKERFLSTLRPLPCAREAVLRMKESGLRVGVATSAEKEELKALLEIAGVADLVEGASSSDDADHSKPDPDIVHAALEKNRTAPRDALLLGDTPYDVAAGRRAGVGVVGVRTGGWTDEELAGALVVYADLRDLLARWQSSPFCSSVASVHQ